jgi:gamma-butyrobetaine dioxygenase
MGACTAIASKRMNLRVDLAEIRARMRYNVASRGYDVLPPLEGLDAESAARDPWEIAAQFFGESPSMVERQPIKPVPQGRSFASNAAFTPLHTDSQMFGGVSPHAQLMFCAKAAREGGKTLLLDTHALLATIQREDKPLFKALFTESRRIPFVFGDVQGPTVSWRANCLVFTHSPMRVEDDIGRKLQAHLSRAPVIEVSVPDGHILVVDNHRMLHGRTAFTDPSRKFTRLLVWLRAGFTRHSAFEEIAQAQAHLVSARSWPSEAIEMRRRIVLEMLRGVPPGVLAQRYGVSEPVLYQWRDAAIAAMDAALSGSPLST